jgi:VIT1/CCC1 family predicted Fe2+/Mn2+ transporter
MSNQGKSLHAFARHYLRDLVYAANDGIVTTFAVVAGVQGAKLSTVTVLALGFANLAADGLSMAVGNYLGIKSEREAESGEQFDEWKETRHAAKHGLVTWGAFIAAGLVPLAPYLFQGSAAMGFPLSVGASVCALFGVGALRTKITTRCWWRAGLEMLLVGSVAGSAAFPAGWGVEAILRR